MTDIKTVKQYLLRFCSESHFAGLADESDYWKKAYTFYKNNENRTMTSLTPPMAKWLTKIVDDLQEDLKK